jgi:hypothetical protein
VNYICSINAGSPLLHNELPNKITLVGTIHYLDIVHRLVFKIKTKTQGQNWSPPLSKTVKETSTQLRPIWKCILTPILSVYMWSVKVTWVSKRFRIALPIGPNCLPHSSALERGPLLSPERLQARSQPCEMQLLASSCLSAWNSTPTGWIFKKFDI